MTLIELDKTHSDETEWKITPLDNNAPINIKEYAREDPKNGKKEVWIKIDYTAKEWNGITCRYGYEGPAYNHKTSPEDIRFMVIDNCGNCVWKD